MQRIIGEVEFYKIANKLVTDQSHEAGQEPSQMAECSVIQA